DNVLVSIPPGGKFQYRYDIASDHPAGTFWYHPHRHGSGFVQVGSGMAGALIVTGNRAPTMTTPGDIDILLKDEKNRAFPERVMLFQQIQYGCLDANDRIEGKMGPVIHRGEKINGYLRPWTCAPGQIGRVESDEHDWEWDYSGRFTGINGEIQPALESARTGHFERWRLIHGGTRERIRMRLYRLDKGAPNLRDVRAADQVQWIERHCRGPALPMWQIAMDGLTRTNVRRTDVAVLFPGDRTDVLTRFPEAGRYCLIHDATVDPTKPLPLRVLAMIEARGTAPVEVDGSAQLQAGIVRAAERALAGREQSALRNKIVGELRDGMRLTSFAWHKPVAKDEVSGHREAIFNIIEAGKDDLFHINGRAYDHDRIDQTLPLGKAEEWHAVSLRGNHPLHMHVNPFQIVKVEDAKGRDVTDPKSPAFDPDYAGLLDEWKDTVFLKADLRVAFRTRYERFTGSFVTHCHIMFHGDHGMMQNLQIVAEGQGAITHSTH
ncbi:MAG: multicopper oxidase domain-containing protein, partial [Thermoflexales bacterium]